MTLIAIVLIVGIVGLALWAAYLDRRATRFEPIPGRTRVGFRRGK